MDAWVTNLVGSFYDLGNVVGNLVDFAIIGLDEVHFLHLCLEELVERFPEALADEEHWHLWHFAFLHEDKNFGEFIESAEAAREEDVDFAGDGEHDFASKEVAELDRVGDVWVDMLLVREFDIETDAASAGFIGAFVGGLHDSWAAAGDNGVAVLSELEAELLGELAPFAVFWKASGAEDRNTLCEGANFGKTLLEVFGVAQGTFNVLCV